MTASVSKSVVFTVGVFRAPNAGRKPRHACMMLDLSVHWDNLYELLRFADRWRGQIPNMTQARVSCHGEWYDRRVLDACLQDADCLNTLSRQFVAPVPEAVTARLGDYSRNLIEMDAEVILAPAPTFKLGTFQFTPGDSEIKPAGAIVETRPVTFALLSSYAQGILHENGRR